jgi:hypothetical protein
VKPVAAPLGVAISTRLRTTPEDDQVLDLVVAHVGGLRRADLARVCQPVPLDPRLDGDAKRQLRRDRLNTRKKALTSQSSARWANAVIAANDDQSPWKTSTSPTHGPPAARRWAAVPAGNASAPPCPGSPLPCSAGVWPPKPTRPASKYWRSIPPTPASGETPNRARTRLQGRATVTPAMANNGQLQT